MKTFFCICFLLLSARAYSQEIAFPKCEGWKADGPILSFNKENLYEHIDGAAEFYLSYGFEALKVASWNNNGVELTIEVYDHGDQLHAYGIYSIERSPGASVKKIGLEGYGDLTIFNFTSGKYYVKMSGIQPDKVPGFSLEALAKDFANTLCKNPEYPKVIGLFPAENQVANSCQYIPSEFMGLGFLGSAVRVKYNLKGEEITLFILERTDSSEAGEIIQKYASFAETKIKPGEGDFLIRDPYNGNVFIRWRGRYLVGATGFSNRENVLDLVERVSVKF